MVQSPLLRSIVVAKNGLNMKTKTEKKDFDTVKTFRAIKEKISKEIYGLSYEQLMAYFEKTKLKTEKTSENQ
jgi:hypothetical protein